MTTVGPGRQRRPLPAAVGFVSFLHFLKVNLLYPSTSSSVVRFGLQRFRLEKKPKRNPQMKIIPVPCLEDNYAYLYESACVACLHYSFSDLFEVISS